MTRLARRAGRVRARRARARGAQAACASSLLGRGEVYACGDVCAHRGGPLSEGKLSGSGSPAPGTAGCSMSARAVRVPRRAATPSRPIPVRIEGRRGLRGGAMTRAMIGGSTWRDAERRPRVHRPGTGQGPGTGLPGRRRRRGRGRPPRRLPSDGRGAVGHSRDRPGQGQCRGGLPVEHPRPRGPLRRARQLFAGNVAALDGYQFVFGKGGVPLFDRRPAPGSRRRLGRGAGRERPRDRSRGVGKRRSSPRATEGRARRARAARRRGQADSSRGTGDGCPANQYTLPS